MDSYTPVYEPWIRCPLLSVYTGRALVSLHVDSFDEAYSVPTEEAALLSLRTQQILQEETGVTQVADPLGGSFYVETLTNEMEERILTELDEIENLGGYVATIKTGWIHRKISDYFRQERERVESGQTRVVAENIYQTQSLLSCILLRKVAPFMKQNKEEHTVAIATLGCKVNQYETQLVKEALEQNGFREALEHETADFQHSPVHIGPFSPVFAERVTAASHLYHTTLHGEDRIVADLA